MSTVDKSIADRIAAGEFAEDRAQRIIKYTNAWGGEAYGVIYASDYPDKYAASDFVQNPVLYWTKDGGKCDV